MIRHGDSFTGLCEEFAAESTGFVFPDASLNSCATTASCCASRPRYTAGARSLTPQTGRHGLHARSWNRRRVAADRGQGPVGLYGRARQAFRAVRSCPILVSRNWACPASRT